MFLGLLNWTKGETKVWEKIMVMFAAKVQKWRIKNIGGIFPQGNLFFRTYSKLVQSLPEPSPKLAKISSKYQEIDFRTALVQMFEQLAVLLIHKEVRFLIHMLSTQTFPLSIFCYNSIENSAAAHAVGPKAVL